MIFLNDIEIGWNEGDKRYIHSKLQRDNIYAGIVAQKSIIPPILYFEGHKITVEQAKRLGVEIPSDINNFRKILFSRNEDNTSNDLLYNSPNYSINDEHSINNGKLFIDKIVYLGELLKQRNFPNYIDDNDIKRIYKMFLKENNKFLKYEYLYLPISYKEFEDLKIISKLTRIPSENVLNKFDKDINFEPKVKIFTKK